MPRSSDRPRSSDSIAALAAALAKAQAELVNPEKSLTAIIRNGSGRGEAERSFRYAPLSRGLDIVRKILGKHEIATVQTTAIDPTSQMVNLTTTLAHASGEWIASDWPVCPVADIAQPQRMGAALTYARRYALFTLVGMAGEDDLDAPDLINRTNTAAGPPSSVTGAPTAAPTNLAGGTGRSPSPHRSLDNGNGRGRLGTAQGRLAVSLNAKQSAELRDELVAEIATIDTPERAARWAQQALPAKNWLATVDAKLVEEAFEHKTAELAASSAVEVDTTETAGHVSAATPPPSTQDNAGSPREAAGTQQTIPADRSDPAGGGGIDKSVLTLSEPRRYRSPAHLRYIAQQACLICGRKPSDPHHLRHLQPRALGRKVSDEYTVPLCRVHHREVHRIGDEQTWWQKINIDPVKVARDLWSASQATKVRIHQT
jgi:hypothetical protein